MRPDPKPRLTAAQITVLCTFFEDNPEVICGYRKTPKFKDSVQSKWKIVSLKLNSLGPPRDHRSWAKYLCNLKAKLKKKKVKWKQVEGSSPIMCNEEEFNEIELRMFQVLKNSKANTNHSNSSDVELDEVKSDKDQDDSRPYESIIDIQEDLKKNTKIESKQTEPVFIKLPNETPPPPPDTHSSHSFYIDSTEDDEFDTFGRNIAQQLRTLPLAVALETEGMLLSVLRKQRLKIITQ